MFWSANPAFQSLPSWNNGRSAFRAAVAAAVSVVALVGSLLLSAEADATQRTAQASGPADGLVRVVSAPDANGTRYLGGDFGTFNPWLTGMGAMVGASSGQVNSSFPQVNGDSIRDSAPDGLGGVYIVGNISTVDGTSRLNAAHINAGGSLDTSWNPAPNGVVMSVAVSGTAVYLGGDFTSVGGADRASIAAVNKTNGDAISGWDAQVTGGRVNAVTVSGSKLYLGGYFQTVGGADQAYAAAVSTGDGSLTGWSPKPDYGVNAIATAGSSVYLGGSFTHVGPSPDPSAHAYAAKVDGTTGAVDDAWNANANDQVFTIETAGGSVFMGGYLHQINNVNRAGAGAVDAATGVLTSWNPGFDGEVDRITRSASGDVLYIGGAFSTVGGIARGQAVAVSATTGAVDEAWDPNCTGGYSVMALTPTASGVYIGGSFRYTGGVRRSGAAAVDASGNLTGWNPNANSSVRSIAVDGDSVYVAGSFNSIGGGTHVGAAKLNNTSGAADPSWNLSLNSHVYAIAVTTSRVYAGGRFSTANSVARRGLVGASKTTGAVDESWDPASDSEVNSILPIGSAIYVGGLFTSIGGQVRGRAAALNESDALATAWNPNANGSVNSMALSGSSIYLGGSFTNVGSLGRLRVAKVDASTSGAVDPTWDPAANGPVNALVAAGSDVYLGGSFTDVNSGTARNRVAKVNGTTGLADANWNPDVSGPVYALGGSATSLLIGGNFSTVGGAARNNLASLNVNGTLGAPWPFVDPVGYPSTHNLLVSKTGSGSGAVSSSPEGITCGSDCTEGYGVGTSVTLTASASADSSFAGWGGACSGTSATCTVAMSEARTVTAEFASVSSPPTPGPSPGPSPKPGPVPVPALPGSLLVTIGARGTSSLDSVVTVSGPGIIRQIGRMSTSSGARTARSLTVCTAKLKTPKAGRYRIGCKLHSAARAARRRRSISVRLITTLTPTRGAASSVTRTVKLKKTSSRRHRLGRTGAGA